MNDYYDKKLVDFILENEDCKTTLEDMLKYKKYNEISKTFSLPKPINQGIIKLYKKYIGDIIKNIHKIEQIFKKLDLITFLDQLKIIKS